MSTEDGLTPKQQSILILVRIACVIAVAVNCFFIVQFAANGTFSVALLIPLSGSLVCTWSVFFYKGPDVQAGTVAQKLENLSEFQSEGLIDESDYERKKQEILDEV